jgi:hypothetical protein
VGRVDADVRNQFLGSAPGTAENDHVMVVLREGILVPIVPGFSRANESARISQWLKESSGIAIFGP